MATHSTVPTVRAQLITLLTARAGLAGVTIEQCHPLEAIDDEAIYLGQSRTTSDIPTIRAGRKARQEQYTLDVWVEVVRDGPTAQSASERSWALVGEIEDMLADDPSLGLSQPFWAVLAEADQDAWVEDSRRGYVSRVRVGIQCEARLT